MVSTNVTFISGHLTCALDAGCDLSSNVFCIGSAGGTCTPTATGCKAGYGDFGCIDDSTRPSGQACCFQADSTGRNAGIRKCQDVSVEEVHSGHHGQWQAPPSSVRRAASANRCAW